METQKLKPSASYSMRRWLRSFVIELNICPFAAPVWEAAGIAFWECDDRDEADIINAFGDACQRMIASNEPETALLIYTEAFEDFDEFWDWVMGAEEILEELGWDAELQLASFHPEYRFEGEDEVTAFTNRAPYPCLHLIRVESMAEALAHYRHPERIPARNKALMQQLGIEKLTQSLQSYYDFPSDNV